MITSSKFFDKTFFPLEQMGQKKPVDEICPWNLMPNRGSVELDFNKNNPQIKKRDSTTLKGYEISRNSSLKYIQKKLKSRSHIVHNADQSREVSPSDNLKKYYTIQQKLNSLQKQKPDAKLAGSMQVIKRIKSNKNKNKKSQLFPQITLNQYNDLNLKLKAKGNGLLNSFCIQDILERKRNRRKILEEFGSGGNGNANGSPKRDRKIKESLNHSVDKNMISGRYVCVAKNPQFSVNGLPTTKLSTHQFF